VRSEELLQEIYYPNDVQLVLLGTLVHVYAVTKGRITDDDVLGLFLPFHQRIYTELGGGESRGSLEN